jgi:hypothetical protein
MCESKNNISIEEYKNILKQKDINNTKYLSIEEEFNLKLEQSFKNTDNININIILKLKKQNLNYKILSICLIFIIMILLIILSIILYNNIYNLLQNNQQNNKTKNDIIPKEKNSNTSIFDIVYNDIIFNNYISGDFFSNLSDNKTIFYVKTDYLEAQAWRVTKNYTVLLTHNSDYEIDSSKFNKFLQCGKFKYWFAQNPIIDEPRIFTLPIGLMNKRWHKYPRFNLMMEEKKKNIKPNKLLLLSFSIKNNKDKRQQCLDSFINKTYATNNVVYEVKNFIGDVKEYDRKYFNIMLDHLFIACPEGNGIDTHRFWETLYMGRYPVVLHNRVNDAFSDLPVLILNKWEYFEKEYLIFLERIKNKKFSYKKLIQEYWIDRINNLE